MLLLFFIIPNFLFDEKKKLLRLVKFVEFLDYYSKLYIIFLK